MRDLRVLKLGIWELGCTWFYTSLGLRTIKFFPVGSGDSESTRIPAPCFLHQPCIILLSLSICASLSLFTSFAPFWLWNMLTFWHQNMYTKIPWFSKVPTQRKRNASSNWFAFPLFFPFQNTPWAKTPSLYAYLQSEKGEQNRSQGHLASHFHLSLWFRFLLGSPFRWHSLKGGSPNLPEWVTWHRISAYQCLGSELWSSSFCLFIFSYFFLLLSQWSIFIISIGVFICFSLCIFDDPYLDFKLG